MLDLVSCKGCIQLNNKIDCAINCVKPDTYNQMDENINPFTLLHDFPRKQDLRKRMSKEPEWDEDPNAIMIYVLNINNCVSQWLTMVFMGEK